jgi:hypothetical protein
MLDSYPEGSRAISIGYRNGFSVSSTLESSGCVSRRTCSLFHGVKTSLAEEKLVPGLGPPEMT